jgi:DNA-binding transcriptional MerR regulator
VTSSPSPLQPPATEPAAGATFSIAQLADEFDVTHRAIRFYEARGLLTPERRGQQRVYHPRDRIRLALVLRGRRLGFSLDEIATIVDMYDAEPGETGQLEYLLAQIGRRRGDLLDRRRDIDQTLGELAAVEQRVRADLARLGTGTPGAPAAAARPAAPAARPAPPILAGGA